MVFVDVTKPFPFESHSFDYILSEHSIEHLEYAEAEFMCRECFRVLRPGGRIRIATPNLSTMANLLQLSRTELQQHYMDWIAGKHLPNYLPSITQTLPGFVINNMFYNPHWGHRFIYDEATMTYLMTQAGFSNIIVCSLGESDDPNLRHIDMHGVSKGEVDMTRYETLILEGEYIPAD